MAASARDRQGQASWEIERTGDVAGWTVTARWWGEADEPATEGPKEALIRLADDATPDVRVRGLNSGVLRRVERLVASMAAEVHEIPSAGAYEKMALEYVRSALDDLPPGPRSDDPDRYYEGLLAIHEDVIGRGHPEPLNLLARAMGVSRETVKTRLRVARQRRDRKE